jgi:hypothetical protein
MTSFARQRWIGSSFFVIITALTVWLYTRYRGQMPRISYFTGWLLFGLIVLLTLFNARKRVPFFPLFSSESWLQFHIYAGLLTAFLFAIHVSYRVPTGRFELALACLYALVMLSGFFGLIVSRAFPKRLTTRGGEVVFERVPVVRRQLKEQAEALVKSRGETSSSILADFYERELKAFLERTRNIRSHWMQSSSPLNRLLNKMSDLGRYLNDDERAKLDQIAGLVRQKDALDYHYALQLLLKGWLFVHIPLTYALLLFIFVHIILIFAFSGGAG